MIRKIFYILGMLSILLTSGCDKISKLFEKAVEEGNIQNSRIPLARVNDKVLYDTELKNLFTDRMTHKDSVNIRDRYINNWVRRVITLEKAAAQVDVEKLDLQRRLDDYKFQLIMHEYEREYIASNLDTLVTDAQIKNYYTKNSEDFILKSNIVKGIFLRYPKNAPDLNKITKWLKSSKEKDKEKLRSSAFAYADFVHLEDSVWLDLDELLFGTPFMKSQSDITKLLKRDRLWEASDESNTFIYQIKDYKIVDQTPPLQFVSNQVKNVILGKRKLELRSELDTKLYDDATKNNEYEIYVSDN
ncbi:hypothetical protein EI427_11775 [Flammeovirga pectinis]|uniref:Peptidyl-prolyl cis-trans isomerase n=1 Tax=Flammeovirga pectinis TaxID=2494373 RepID=A0A3S9P3U5_9BACT|nr:hypothetical protein [Flammeovirga pectinis]AZQ62889.1 hypothetical protein EI427_11775 [Flammeovirga pectinis]